LPEVQSSGQSTVSARQRRAKENCYGVSVTPQHGNPATFCVGTTSASVSEGITAFDRRHRDRGPNR
jgi:uncharacterized membrane protein